MRSFAHHHVKDWRAGEAGLRPEDVCCTIEYDGRTWLYGGIHPSSRGLFFSWATKEFCDGLSQPHRLVGAWGNYRVVAATADERATWNGTPEHWNDDIFYEWQQEHRPQARFS